MNPYYKNEETRYKRWEPAEVKNQARKNHIGKPLQAETENIRAIPYCYLSSESESQMSAPDAVLLLCTDAGSRYLRLK
jgi:hypothetical protein